MLTNILAILLAYLISALPTAYILAKLQGKNIFELGSGNMGAMNTFRNLGIAAGITVLIIDISKGYFAIRLASLISHGDIVTIYAAAIAVTLGHAWSVYVGFRGGKALSTSFGALLALNLKVALFLLFAIIISSLVFKKKSNFAVVLASSSYSIMLIALFFIKQEPKYLNLFIPSTIIFLIIFYKHIPGLKREFAKKPTANDSMKQ